MGFLSLPAHAAAKAHSPRVCLTRVPVASRGRRTARRRAALPRPRRRESTALVGHPFGAFPFRRAGRPRGRPCLPAVGAGRAKRSSARSRPGFQALLPPEIRRTLHRRRAGGSRSMLPWASASSRGVSSLLATNRRAQGPAVFPLLDFLHTHPKASYPVLQSFDRRGEWPHARRRRHPLRGFRAAVGPPKRSKQRRTRVSFRPRRPSYPLRIGASSIYLSCTYRNGESTLPDSRFDLVTWALA
jgi:hypothetical protein